MKKKPTAAARRAAKRWRDAELSGEISGTRSATNQLAEIIDAEFADVVAALRSLLEECLGVAFQDNGAKERAENVLAALSQKPSDT